MSNRLLEGERKARNLLRRLRRLERKLERSDLTPAQIAQARTQVESERESARTIEDLADELCYEFEVLAKGLREVAGAPPQ